ncbi:PREDICTED: RNA polymerase II-associated protein 1-like [Priapulus caudatus]|uniref:RNA polymerase II-associated protein 1-like n=1 Tax=Priapulus caudatus TaxID=37621 RepID=A0ABM1DUY9_PRICU|nr:PREDICTED: RNA polymerase II-associated protein 1-like [Priapulus caudatus]
MAERLQRGETEEDLLRFQKEFLAAKSKPSAVVVKRKSLAGKGEKDTTPAKCSGLNRPVDHDVVSMDVIVNTPVPGEEPDRKKSKFKERKNVKFADEEMDTEALLDEHDTHLTAVLSKIIERDVGASRVSLPLPNRQGFPVAQHRGVVDKDLPLGQPGKRQSLFSQQLQKSNPTFFSASKPDIVLGQEDHDMKRQPSSSPVSATHERNANEKIEKHRMAVEEVETALGSNSCIIEGSGLGPAFGKVAIQSIHEENVSKLAAMSNKEILQEQEKLAATIDPKILGFLLTRRKPSDVSMATNVMEPVRPPSASKRAEELLEAMKAVAGGSRAGTDEKVETTGAGKHDVPELDESELLVKPKKEWLNMNKIEYDKMAWLKELPPVDKNKINCPARFDFEGMLVPRSEEIPVSRGLHHHGDEPEVAGYTLDELMHLSRSTILQQRVIALQTITKVLNLAHCGMYDGYLSQPVIPQLLDAGLIFLLRFSLDDPALPVLSASVQALAELLAPPSDEVCLDRVFAWHRGTETPRMSVSEEQVKEKRVKEEEENGPLTDAELVKHDLIKGLLKMFLLPRLRYILYKCEADESTTQKLLDLLIRVARHSSEAAQQILYCPGLLDIILDKYLPIVSCGIGGTMPLSRALKLLRVICMSGRYAASTMLARHRVMNIVTCYVTVEPSELLPDASDAFVLSNEALRLWIVCVTYGHACDEFLELYPLLMENIRRILSLYQQGVVTPAHSQRLTLIVKLLESVTSVAATRKDSLDRLSMRPNEAGDQLAPPAVRWSHVMSLVQPIETCLKLLLGRWMQILDIEECYTELVSACMNFLATYYNKFKSQSEYNAVDCLEHVDTLCSELLLHFSTCDSFQKALSKLGTFTAFCEKVIDTKHVESDSLPTLHCSRDVILCPVIRSKTPYAVITSYLRMIDTFSNLHHGLNTQLFTSVLECDHVVSYLQHVARTTHQSSTWGWFSRHETHLLYYLVRLSSKQSIAHARVDHQVALRVLANLLTGDEHYAYSLLSSVIFNPELIRAILMDSDIIAGDVEKLKLVDQNSLQGAALFELEASSQLLLREALDHVAKIRGTYMQAASALGKLAEKSRCHAELLPFAVTSQIQQQAFDTILPHDWIFSPIVDLYNKSTDISNYCSALKGHSLELCSHRRIGALNFSEAVPGISSFADLYRSLLEHFEAVSFGDALFSCFVIVPLQQRYSTELRKVIWGEHMDCLRIMRVPLTNLPVAISAYLHPTETDVDLLTLYFRVLIGQIVHPETSPLMYLVAVRHISNFLFANFDPKCQIYDMKYKYEVKIRKKMLLQLSRVNNVELRQHILRYKQASTAETLGFELYVNVPQHVNDVLFSHGLSTVT